MNVPVLSLDNVIVSLHNIRLCSTYHCCDFHYVSNITCTIILHNAASYHNAVVAIGLSTQSVFSYIGKINRFILWKIQSFYGS